MVREAIILAGGLGTRLRSVVSELPKCMAPVAGHPFLHYVISYYKRQGIERFIFALGYKHEAITSYLSAAWPGMPYEAVIEEEPLGTGGAIKLACTKSKDKNVLVLNGDTIFRIHAGQLWDFHTNKNAGCSLCLKPMINFDRYGVVETNEEKRITSFKEKQHYEEGMINGGVYLLNKAQFLEDDHPEKFSFEKDYLEAGVKDKKFFGLMQDCYFIDIGIPEDFAKANLEFAEQDPS